MGVVILAKVDRAQVSLCELGIFLHHGIRKILELRVFHDLSDKQFWQNHETRYIYLWEFPNYSARLLNFFLATRTRNVNMFDHELLTYYISLQLFNLRSKTFTYFFDANLALFTLVICTKKREVGSRQLSCLVARAVNLRMGSL